LSATLEEKCRLETDETMHVRAETILFSFASHAAKAKSCIDDPTHNIF
jgi:hypothetical protein